MKAFDHRKAGFALDGKHAGLSCQSCHNTQKIGSGEHMFPAGKNLNRTYLGLSQTCASCHVDKHKGQLGSNCTQCHNTGGWKSTKAFDHAKTRFPLTGAHVQTSCEKCHTPGPDGTTRYAGLQFARCSSCHADPHHGSFKQTCESCHSTRSWKQSSVASNFDHSKTNYPLLGKHVLVQCESCHRGADFKAPIAHSLCADCHKPDPHHGQFANRADGGRCESCHTVEGFKQATFTIADHDRTGFPLHGKHASVQCDQCHKLSGKSTLFKVKFSLCVDCHKDAHLGQFAGSPRRNHCEQCHNEQTFRPSTMTIARHQKETYVLTGGHLAVACMDCHKPMPDSTVATYHFAGLRCVSCHADPHKDQFAARMSRTNASGKPVGCEACHSTKTWKDLTSFDHGSTSFALTGSHRAVACGDCHRPPNMEQSMMNVSFNLAPPNCEGCHENPHGPQFASSDGTTKCAACHNSTKWRPSLFDHEKTIFSLQGAHHDVRCGACHTTVTEIAGKQVLTYKPTPTACSSCHGTKDGMLRPSDAGRSLKPALKGVHA